ncbi:MAG: glutamyl-tRNA reductase [Anaerolineaceae bacterium]|nr:glutamyl-tRNA reductase [Anaerolineaceae bacterium]
MERQMSSARLVLLGLSYRTAPIELRERLSCSLTNLPPDWQTADNRFAAIQELAILSTCNRTELIARVNCPGLDARTLLADILVLMKGVDKASFDEHLYLHTGLDAANHLCRVASGLDSQVLGEPQILGQVTDAFMAATNAKTIGPALTELFRTAIRCGKRARSETAISQNPVSTSSMAVAQAQAILGDLAQRQHLIIGAGEMGHLALKVLWARGATNIALANRSRERAEALASEGGLPVYGLDELATAVSQTDVVISATSAETPLITRQLIENVMQQRSERPLILIDIAVPRDIDPAVRRVNNVHLFDADELKQSLDEALAARQQEIPAIEVIIEAELEMLSATLRGLAVRPVIVDLRHKAETIRQQELDRTLRYLGELDPATLAHIQHFSRALVNKLLHEPTLRLRDRAVDEKAAVYASTVRDLFGLNDTTFSQEGPFTQNYD